METDHLNLLKQAAVEATHEYVDMSLSALPLIHPVEIKNLPDVDADILPGSFMTLLMGEKSIVIGLSAQKDLLMHIAKAIMEPVDGEKFSQVDMQDAINEMLNVVCGGLKRRLNDKIPGGITLGIPEFYQKAPEVPSERELDKVLIAQCPVYIWAMQ